MNRNWNRDRDRNGEWFIASFQSSIVVLSASNLLPDGTKPVFITRIEIENGEWFIDSFQSSTVVLTASNLLPEGVNKQEAMTR